jgi:hypothetical protein
VQNAAIAEYAILRIDPAEIPSDMKRFDAAQNCARHF